jgi:hypothetical protein
MVVRVRGTPSKSYGLDTSEALKLVRQHAENIQYQTLCKFGFGDFPALLEFVIVFADDSNSYSIFIQIRLKDVNTHRTLSSVTAADDEFESSAKHEESESRAAFCFVHCGQRISMKLECCGFLLDILKTN